MPREIIHWSVVTRGIELLRERGSHDLADLLERYPAVVELGAVAHDAPYYHRFGRSPFVAVAERLHGTHGEDTFEPMRHYFQAVDSWPAAEERDLLRAFLYGMLSHIATDATFHPMIYYLTGNYYDPDPARRRRAQTQHRLLEVYLDSWAIAEGLAPVDHLIASRVRSLGAHMHSIARLLGGWPPNYVDTDRTTRLWSESLTSLARLQRLFLSASAGLSLRCITAIIDSLTPVDALCRFGRGKVPEWLDGEICYRNPVSGKEEVSNIGVSLQSATVLWMKYLTASSSLLAGGPSLNFKTPTTSVSEATFYSNSS